MIMVIMIQSVDAELRSCMKVEMAVLVTDSPYGLCGRKATLKKNRIASEPRSFMNREVGMGSHSLSHSSPVPNKHFDLKSLINYAISVDVKHHG